MSNSSDRSTIHLVIIALAVLATVGLLGILVLLYLGRTVDAALYTLVGGLTASLGSLLASTRSSAGGNRATDATPVTVTNSDSNPVPVDDAGAKSATGYPAEKME